MKQTAIAIILFWTFSLIYKILSGYDSSIMQVEKFLLPQTLPTGLVRMILVEIYILG
jgi:hypothetical protein